MMRLHSEWRYLEREFGCGLSDHFLMAVRSFDNAKTVTPLLLENGNRRYGLFLHVEKGNVAAARLPPDIEPIFYQPYYSFEPGERGNTIFPNLEAALAHAASGERELEIDRHLPAGLMQRLGAEYRLRLEEGLDPGTISLTPVTKETVLQSADAHRAQGAASAAKLLERSLHRAELLRYLDARDDQRFALLNELVEAEGLEAILVSSVLNVQDIAGVPMWGKRRPIGALYTRSGIWLMEAGSNGEARSYGSVSAALSQIAPRGRLGVEMDDVESWLFRAAGLDNRDVYPVDNLLRQWRDRSTLPDLGYYVIATRASERALRRALGYAQEQIAAGERVTEMDAYGVYLDVLREFVAAHAPGLRVGRTLTNFHSGARTIFPANPAAYPLSPAINTLKIDAGCLLLDPSGMLLGCSDIARTLCYTDEAEELYDLFRDSIRHTAIPSCRSGMAGSQIHETAVGALRDAGLSPVTNRLYPGLESTAAYDRDTGHLLGRNNLAHLKFTRSETGILREGMIACCEYQWPISGHAVAYEDTCLVTPSGGLNLTVDG